MKCQTKYCRNQALKSRKLCAKCRSRNYKQKYPFKYYYNLAKQNAKKRHIPFGLTFDQYKEIWTQSGKWQAKLDGQNYSMDRMNVNLGYQAGNVRIVPVLLNVQVWHDEQKWQVDFRWRKMWSERNNKPIEECPF